MQTCFFFQTEYEFFREINFKNFLEEKKIMKLKSELFLKIKYKIEKKVFEKGGTEKTNASKA